MIRSLARYVPTFMKPALRKIYYFPSDLFDLLRGRDPLVPPRSMIFVGDGDFEGIGREFLRHFIEVGGLGSDERVLDVGCGIGRMAVPLTRHLSSEGEYYGFDIVREGIEWCQQRISSRFGNFHFQHVDLYNKNYNPGGRVQAGEFQFPYEDDRFDFVVLTSVFTHMYPEDVMNYLSEISRVLKPGGRSFITFFLWNPESAALSGSGRSKLDFKHELEGCRTADPRNPEAAIAYEEARVREWFAKNSLCIKEPIRYGNWCGRSDFLSYQDVVLATKE